jgi:hypothetical protein
LIHSRKSTCKGGTVIAGNVWTLTEHRRLMSGVEGGYRPLLLQAGCPTCNEPKLHVHDYRERKALGAMLLVAVAVVRFICVNPQCRATWQVLPAFVARHLWYAWRAVEQETAAQVMQTEPEPVASATPPAPTPAAGTTTQRRPSTQTRGRWLQRLRSSATQLVQLMMSRAGKTKESIVGELHSDGSRAQLVECYAGIMGVASGRRYAAVAALVDALERGIRLM